MSAGFWEFISLLCIVIGVAITFPYWGPALRAHYANAQVENEVSMRRVAERLRAREERERRENRRAEDLMNVTHRKEIAVAEADAIRAEAGRDALRMATEQARDNGDLEASGRSMLNLPKSIGNGR